MLNVYKVMSSNISEAIAQHGEICAKQPLIKSMRVVKKESLNLISSWISKSADPEMVVENFIPPNHWHWEQVCIKKIWFLGLF